MKVEIKEVVDQLTKAFALREGYKVAMNIDDDGHIVGWSIVKVEEDGTIIAQWSTPSLEELIRHYF